jgi:hypothetical protein
MRVLQIKDISSPLAGTPETRVAHVIGDDGLYYEVTAWKARGKRGTTRNCLHISNPMPPPKTEHVNRS